MRKDKKKIFSPFAIASVVIFAFIGTLHYITNISYSFADRINESVSQAFRKLLASFGELFNFSLFEIVVLCLPLVIAFVIYKAVKTFKSGEGRLRFIINLLRIQLWLAYDEEGFGGFC